MVERAYKYRFYPTAEQENLLRRTMGCVRLVYNKALATKTEGWYQRQERIDYKQTSRNMVRNRSPLAPLIKGGWGDSDAAWGEMFRQLEYKCDWYGRTLVKIDRFFPSSKRCNHCGFVMDKLPLDIRSWDCPSCETKEIDRDINAGKNILAAGLAVIVCGADIRPDRHSSKGQLRKTRVFEKETET
jgi:transposase